MIRHETNFTNETTYYPYSGFDYHRMQTVETAFFVVDVFLAVAGALVNLWYLAAILTSAEMRSPLRNKVICNTCVLHLIDILLIILWLAGVLASNDHETDCTISSAYLNIIHILAFIANWLVVMLVAVFIAQIQDVNPTTRLTPRATTLCTLGLMLLPWVTPLIFVPIVYFSSRIVTEFCSYITVDADAIFKSIDTAVPIVLAILLVITATGLRYRRYTRGHSSGSMRAELISREPEVDTIFAYVAAVVVSITCDLFKLIYSLDITFPYTEDTVTYLMVTLATFTLSDARSVLMPLAWLLLPDIRQRLKTWRPWRRSTSGIDLTVTYRREDNE